MPRASRSPRRRWSPSTSRAMTSIRNGTTPSHPGLRHINEALIDAFVLIPHGSLLGLQAEAGAALLVGADPVVGDEFAGRHGVVPRRVFIYLRTVTCEQRPRRRKTWTRI